MSLPLDSNAVSLLTYGEQSNDPVIKSVIMSLYEQQAVASHMPWINSETIGAMVSRFTGNLPNVNFNGINALPTVVQGIPNRYNEQCYRVLNQIQIDRTLRKDKASIEDPASVQLRAYKESLKRAVNDTLINGETSYISSGTAGSTPAGLYYRLSNTAQYGIPSEMAINASGINISASGLSQTTANQFIEYVDTALSYTGDDDGNGAYIYCNDITKRRFAAAVRELGAGAGFEITKDAYDRTVSRYRNAIVMDIGRQQDQITRIISQYENSSGVPSPSTNSYNTSLYIVRYGSGLFSGLQFEPLNSVLEPLPGTKNDALTIEWWWGFLQSHNRSAARIYNIFIGNTAA